MPPLRCTPSRSTATKHRDRLIDWKGGASVMVAPLGGSPLVARRVCEGQDHPTVSESRGRTTRFAAGRARSYTGERNPFTLFTQVPKEARDDASQAAHPAGRTSPSLRRR